MANSNVDKVSLKQARAESGLKQTFVAEKLHISRDYLHKIESGKVIPRVTLAYALADLYGKQIDQIDFYAGK